MSQPEEEKCLGWDLDEVLTDLKFGTYQLKNLILIGLLIMFSNLYPLSFILTAGDLDYRCIVPECENVDDTAESEYMPSWIEEAIPFIGVGKESKYLKCKRFKPLANATFVNDTTCTDAFDKLTIDDCHKWVFATEEKTLVTEVSNATAKKIGEKISYAMYGTFFFIAFLFLPRFNITCENNKWELSLIGTINNIGQFFGIPIFGIISDRYGRKFVTILCSVMSAVFGICRGLSTSYLMFATFEFLDSFFGSAIYGTAFILGIELVNPKMRPLAATIIGTFYPMGAVIMGFVAWYFQDWRKLLLACYTPGLLFILYFWMIPESIRWLQMNGYYTEASNILKKISDSNNIELFDKTELQEKAIQMQKHSDKENKEPFWKPIITVFKSKYILFRLLNCSFSWFTNTLVYYGLSINSVELVGNKFLNFILTNGVEVPAFILSGFIMDKVERRISQSGAFFLSGVACILCEFIPSDMFLLQIVLYLVSKFLITISFNILYIYSAEMFPTELRLSLCGFASMFGRIGSMIAPQTILLKSVVGEHAPVLLFGIMSIIAGGLATSFPETFNKKLPDTVNQAKMGED